MIHVLDGRGSTAVWNDAGQKITFEWKAGALFAIPLNAWHRHFNGSGKDAARYVAVTNAPVIINAFGDIDFVFNTRYDFKDRFSGEPDYFANKGEQRGLLLDTNFVADAVNLPLMAAKERRGGRPHPLQHAKAHEQHISQFRGHLQRRMPRARRALIVMSGEGFSLMCPRGRAAAIEWKEGTMIVPQPLFTSTSTRHHAGALPRVSPKGSR